MVSLECCALAVVKRRARSREIRLVLGVEAGICAHSR